MSESENAVQHVPREVVILLVYAWSPSKAIPPEAKLIWCESESVPDIQGPDNASNTGVMALSTSKSVGAKA